MKNLFVFVFLINGPFIFSQNEVFSIDSIHAQSHSIIIGVKIKSENEILVPVETEMTVSLLSFTFFQYELETEKKGKYSSETRTVFYDYIPEVLWMKTEYVKDKEYHIAVANPLIEKGKKYRIRFIIYYDRFNKSMKAKYTRWYFFRG